MNIQPQISTVRPTRTPGHLSRRRALKALSLASVATLSNLHLARADDPPPEDPDTLPKPKKIDDIYQPKHYSTDLTTVLRRVTFSPVSTALTFPAVVLIHGGQYFEGSYYAPQELLDAAADLNAAGYIVFSVDHRLARSSANPIMMIQRRAGRRSRATISNNSFWQQSIIPSAMAPSLSSEAPPAAPMRAG